MSDVVRESVADYGAKPRLMTVDDYYRAADAGIFDSDERIELLRGIVVEKSGEGLRAMTVQEYYRAADEGIFDSDEKLELIWGQVVKLSPQKSPHAWAAGNMAEVLGGVFPDCVIRQHSPMRLDKTNEPEPDVLVARGPRSKYVKRHPGPPDTLLLVEVADTSLRKDRTLKTLLYAAFGISEYWILDLKSNRLEVYREPAKDASGKAAYTVVQTLDAQGSVIPLKAATEISVRSLLPL
ncbi:MAG: Uma2 family endonuclease [Fimbriimonadales bacterium]